MVRVTLKPARDYTVYMAPTLKLNTIPGDVASWQESYRLSFGTGGATFGPLVIRTSVRGTVVHVAGEALEVVCEHEFLGPGAGGVYQAQASLALGRAVESWVASSETAPRPGAPAETLVKIPVWSTHFQYLNTLGFTSGSIRQLRENGNVLCTSTLAAAVAGPILLHEQAYFIDGFGAPTPTVELRDILFRILF